MKKYLYLVTVIVLLAGGYIYLSQNEKSLGGGAIDTDDSIYCDGYATTSVVTLGIGAQANTSSCIVNVAGVEKFSIDTQMNAEAVTSALSLKLYVSQGQDGVNCADRPTACDWYDLPNVTADSVIANTVGSTTAAYTYSPETSGFNRFSILINPADHKYFKIARSAITATSTVWTRIALTRGY